MRIENRAENASKYFLEAALTEMLPEGASDVMFERNLKQCSQSFSIIHVFPEVFNILHALWNLSQNLFVET